jgi:hypothetical protein
VSFALPTKVDLTGHEIGEDWAALAAELALRKAAEDGCLYVCVSVARAGTLAPTLDHVTDVS